MDLLTIITILIIISAAFSYINLRLLKLPSTIGVITISVFVSLIILIIGKIGSSKANLITKLANNIDFSSLLLNVLLGLLLFATALHFDYKKLKELRRPIIVLSTVGVLVSTAVFGLLFYEAGLILHTPVPLIYCFVFGALVSPTDPIAVAAILKKSRIPPRIEIIISGESMFNDAVGLILFVTFLHIAGQSELGFPLGHTMLLFAQEVIGGLALGTICGYVGYRFMRSINDFQTIVLISLAVVLGLSIIAGRIHVSVPLAAVAAGLIIGNLSFSQSNPCNGGLSRLWQLLDEVLNTILFVMMGLQLVLLPFLNNYWLIALLAIMSILVARLISVLVPALFVLRKINFGNLSVLTWAGLRGGISIAMALSLPQSDYREIILSCCYFIVLFSVIVQGLTLNKVVDAIAEKKKV